MERMYRFGTLCGVFCALILAPRSVYSAPSFNAPNSFSYEGILKDSSGNPITSSTVKLRLYVLPDAASGSSCVLLRDEHSLDLSASNGYFSVGIGSSPKSGSATVDGDPGNQLAKVFQNRYVITGNNGTTTCNYSPAAQHNRRLQIHVSTNGGSTWETFSDYHYINSVPSSQVADSLQGYHLFNFTLALPTATLTGMCGAANINAMAYDTTLDKLVKCNGSSWVPVSGNGVVSVSGSGGISASSTTGAVSLSLSNISSGEIASGAITPAKLENGTTAGEILRWNGSAWQRTILSLPSNTILGINPGFGLTSSTSTGVVTISMVDNFIKRTGDSLTGQFGIVGSSDQPELEIKQSAGQTADALVIKSSAGVERFSVKADGTVRIDSSDAVHVSSTKSNVALGPTGLPLSSNTNNNNNTAVGWHAMLSNVSGRQNSALGKDGLYNNTSGAFNVAVGNQSLFNNTTGQSNIALGYQSLSSLVTGSSNVSVGYQSGYSTGGSNNVFLGYKAGLANTGSGNIFIGMSSGSSETGSDKLYIDNSGTASPLIYGDFASDTLKFNGSVGVSGPLDMYGNGIKRVSWPSATDDAVIKKYADIMFVGNTVTGAPTDGQVPTYNASAQVWYFSTPASTAGGGGDITEVIAGSGMAGGAASGSATLSIAYGGVANSLIADGAVSYQKLTAGAVTGDRLGSFGATATGQMLRWNQGLGQWESYDPDIRWVNVVGDTMSGALNMGGNKITSLDDPVGIQDATTRNYVDTVIGSLDAQYVRKAGDTMPGSLTVQSQLNADNGFSATGGGILDGFAHPTGPNQVSTKNYSDYHLAGSTISTSGMSNYDVLRWDTSLSRWTNSNIFGATDGTYVNTSGDTMYGTLSISMNSLSNSIYVPSGIVRLGDNLTAEDTALHIAKGRLYVGNWTSDNVGVLFETNQVIHAQRPSLIISSQTSGYDRIIEFASGMSDTNGPTARWMIRVDNVSETGGNAGSDFAISRVGDTGDWFSPVFYARRSDGAVAFNTTYMRGQFNFNGDRMVVSSPGAYWGGELRLYSGTSYGERFLQMRGEGDKFFLATGADSSGSSNFMEFRWQPATTNTIVMNGVIDMGGRDITNLPYPTGLDLTAAANVQYANNNLAGRSIAGFPTTADIGTIYQYDGSQWVLSEGGPRSCPSNMTLIGTAGDSEAFCVDNGYSNMASASLANVIATGCGGTKHLCSASELIKACQVGATVGWSATHHVSDFSTTNNITLILSSCASPTIGSVSANTVISRDYRCCK